MSELKPCPFCGPNTIVEVYESDYGAWLVGCGACGSHSGIRPDNDKEKVIERWNTRADGWIITAEQLPPDRVPVEIWWTAGIGRDPGPWFGQYLKGLDEFRPDGCIGDFRNQITHWKPRSSSPAKIEGE